MSKRTTYRQRLASLLAIALLVTVGLAGAPEQASADMTFPETGATVWGPFEQDWKAHGGLAQFGMPRTGVFPAKEGYDAQWFERAMFTYNPRNPDPHKVELQLLGAMIAAGRQAEDPFRRTAAGASMTGQYFTETGHNLTGRFLEYWRSKGGLPIYGYPISEAFTERSKSDGKEYTVQYFERNRFELHPEMAGTPYEVQLGLLGSELLDAAGGPSAFANLGAPHSYPAQGTTYTNYPQVGHAPDYSWVAGQVVFTRIQGGCIFIRSGEETFVPNGEGWSRSQVKDGDYVVIFGHVAGADEPREVCPGGKAYIVERFMLNQ